MKQLKLAGYFLIPLLLAACLNPARQAPELPPTTNPTDDPQPTNTATSASGLQSSLSADLSTNEPLLTNTALPTAAQQSASATGAESASTPQPQFSPPNWPPPARPYDNFSQAPVTGDEQRTAQQLENNLPPARDDIALAGLYQGIAAPVEEIPLVSEPLSVGTRQHITINNFDSNSNSIPEFVLRYVSDHAYFWFDTTEGLAEPSSNQLETMGAGFDEIYGNSHLIFGLESTPGIDGDPRIHIINASPLNLCDVTLDSANQCFLAGYFSSHDLVPKSVDPTSNAREMFVMNGRGFGTNGYLDVLAHEFRHMIEENNDVNDWDWEVEGSAMLAEELLGFPGDGIARANSFLREPDQQLNRWSEDDTLPRYGQGYLFNRYIYNRLGPDLYRQFAVHPAPAFAALDELATDPETDFESGLDLWLVWLAALVIHEDPDAPDQYELADGVNTAVTQPLQANIETTVYQYAADYYELDRGQQVTFSGSNHVPLLSVQPTSGSQMWLANRANFSSPTLAHNFDLTSVESATLAYDVFRDIETGYDFAYVAISTDEGQTWQALSGAYMQGNEFEDDPSGSALTERFYTGQADDWVQETIDLTSYSGQEVQIRFEYVTDPILTYGGLALDNIAIPEIGFFDDAETDRGWQADGFVRASGYLPQSWHLILISFPADGLQIERLEIGEGNTAVIPVPTGSRPPILIVAASAPMTLEPAHYRLDLK